MNLCQACPPQDWHFASALVVLGLLVWEWWLGRYGKNVKSIIDMVLFAVLAAGFIALLVLKSIFSRRKPNGSEGN